MANALTTTGQTGSVHEVQRYIPDRPTGLTDCELPPASKCKKRPPAYYICIVFVLSRLSFFLCVAGVFSRYFGFCSTDVNIRIPYHFSTLFF